MFCKSRYDIADATGTVVWDENRDLRESGLQAQESMVRQHRNHPSVVIYMYSLCNEGECTFGSNKTGVHPGSNFLHNDTVYGQFTNLTRSLDPSRAIGANQWGEYGPGTVADFLDVQGLSHPRVVDINGARALAPERLIIVSECCSCQSQRGENTGTVNPDGPMPANITPGVDLYNPAFNGDCLQQEVGRSDALEYIAGSMIWTLGDYLGESAPVYYPHVSSSFGAIDLAGFPKAGSRWFEAWWLQSQSPLSATSRPTLPTSDMVHIVESNAPPPPSTINRTIHVYSSAAAVELLVNGASLGVRSNAEWMGWMEWNVTASTAGNMTAVARSQAAAVVATHTRITAAVAAAIVLTNDAPSPTTGTGQRLVLDGHDVALVRATVVDAQGVANCNINANFYSIFVIKNAERMQNHP